MFASWPEATLRGLEHMDPEQKGSIDDQPVRDLVEEILEAGKDAFERRWRSYGD